MRFIARIPLDSAVEKKLNQMQTAVNESLSRSTEGFDSEKRWKSSRRSSDIQEVAATLKQMMGVRERCMYCLDSHGTDIEHFWPKTRYPERMFLWNNLLLCCTECGRFKRSKFPLNEYGEPLLIDPTIEDPWQYLDFDPETGNITARYMTEKNDWSAKGEQTVECFHLDCREALASVYRKGLRRLEAAVEVYLTAGEFSAISTERLFQKLKEEDDHGLVQWCITHAGKDREPFRTLRVEQPEQWGQLTEKVETMYKQ